MFCMLNKKKYILIAFQNIIKIVKKFILLMISNREGWHYLAVKKLFVLLKRITSTRSFFLSESSSFFAIKKKLESHIKVCENRNFCNVVMPSEDTKISETII